MAQLLFRNYSLSTLETMLENSSNAVSQGGKTIISYTEAGRTVTKQFALPFADFMDELNEALSYKDPDRYGSLITSTRISFAQGNDGGANG